VAPNNEEDAGSLGEGTRPYPGVLLYAKALLGAQAMGVGLPEVALIISLLRTF
jgi:hypothetical protein